MIGVLVFGRASDTGGRWGLVAVAVPVLLGVLRYLTTSYRLTPSRVEVRHGLLNKQVLSAPLDRVRTVDLTASPIHRALGPGHRPDRDRPDHRQGRGAARRSTGCPHARPAPLRQTLLHVSPSADPAADAFAPRPAGASSSSSTRAGCVSPRSPRPGWCIAGAALGLVAQGWHTFAIDPAAEVQRFERLGGPPAGHPRLSLRRWWGSACSRWPATWSPTSASSSSTRGRRVVAPAARAVHHPRDQPRRRPGRGREHREPLGLRLAHGARLSAIVTGLDKKQQGSSVLVPPAPRGEVDRVAAEVLGRRGPVYGDLVRHDARPRRRRWSRAMRPGRRGRAARARRVVRRRLVVGPRRGGRPRGRRRYSPTTAGRRWATPCSTVTWWPARAASTAAARRSHTPSVIGWNLRATFFQRRSGLTDLVATTAGGRQRVRVLDLDEQTAVTSPAPPRRGCSTSSWPDRVYAEIRKSPVQGGSLGAMRRLPPAARTLCSLDDPPRCHAPCPQHRSRRRLLAATKLATPDKLTSAKGVPGPYPGQTTIRWESTGRYTDYYKITTALTRSGRRHTPRFGRHSTTFA